MTTTPHSKGAAPLLRIEAENRLREGTAPPARGDTTLSISALQLLHDLASSPGTAADALKLLHELQVHQVELDMQLEQQEQNEQELGQELAHFKDLFELAPLGYLILTRDGQIMEANQAAIDFLGVVSDELPGQGFASFLAAPSRPTFAGLLNQLSQNGLSMKCQVQADPSTGSSGTLELNARVAPKGDAVLLITSRQD